MKDPYQGSVILVHGAPKVGKTQLACSFPSPNFLIATEAGHRYIPEEMKKTRMRLAVGESTTKYRGQDYVFRNGWEKLLWILDEGFIAKRKAKTVTLDSIGPLYQMCMDYVCLKGGWEHPQDAGHGKGWATLGREFAKGLGRLTEQAEEIGATTLVIGHSKKSEIDAGNRTYTRIEVNLPGQAYQIVMPSPDHIWYLGFHSGEEDSTVAFENNRALWLQPTPVIEAGGRNPGIKKKFISPLKKTRQYEQILKAIRKTDNG
jgi:hypothetical protein